MRQMQKSVLALAVFAAISVPAIAASVDVKVTGTILPAACTPTLSGGGTIDYGEIRADSLSSTDYTVLPVKQLDFSIRCDAPAKVAVKAIENRQNTAVGNAAAVGGIGIAPTMIFGSNQVPVAGLGMSGDKRIGGYAIRIAGGSSIADNKGVSGVYSLNHGDSWQYGGTGSTSGILYNASSEIYQSWAPAYLTDPVAFENVSAKLEVQAYLNKSSELDLSKAIQLDGLTTLELVYL